ncbi:MAG: hypothetical protein GYB68_12065, partial [Chloroflexi bacterium]|nr:hypothetical protein [Chloroflexota bacterium]
MGAYTEAILPEDLPSTGLSGWPWRLAQAIWIILVVASLVWYVIAVPSLFELLSTPRFNEAELVIDSIRAEAAIMLSEIGLSAQHCAVFVMVLNSIPILIATGLALLLFWRKSDDWMVLAVSAFMVMYSVQALSATLEI